MPFAPSKPDWFYPTFPMGSSKKMGHDLMGIWVNDFYDGS